VGCLVDLLALISPRFALALLWLFTSRLTVAFSSGWTGLLGFLFLPYATVFYSLAYRPGRGVGSFGWILVAFGLLLDLGSLFSSDRTRRRRTRRRLATSP
jgi:hypothetical protein